MKNFESNYISTADNLKLNFRIYGELQNANKIILVSHGYGEHQGFYFDFADFFSDNGFTVLTYDLRSHGLSEGRRGDVAEFELFLTDLNTIVTYANNLTSGKQIFLFGHSLGGTIVINYLLRFYDIKISKAVISSPWLKLAFDPPFYKLILAKIGKILFPSLVIKGELKTSDLSRDSEFIKKFENDPLTYDKISSRYYFSILNAGWYALENASKIKIPVLVSHGDDDKVVSYEASKQFCLNSDTEFKSWDGGYKHVVFSEKDKNDIFAYYLKYLGTI